MVHIIGQPSVTNWFYTVQIVCACKHPVLLVGQVGARAQCANPDCRKLYSLNALPTLDPDGNINFPLGMASAPGNGNQQQPQA